MQAIDRLAELLMATDSVMLLCVLPAHLWIGAGQPTCCAAGAPVDWLAGVPTVYCTLTSIAGAAGAATCALPACPPADYIKHASIKNKALQRAIDEVRRPAASLFCFCLLHAAAPVTTAAGAAAVTATVPPQLMRLLPRPAPLPCC